jgi:hypothetical protein
MGVRVVTLCAICTVVCGLSRSGAGTVYIACCDWCCCGDSLLRFEALIRGLRPKVGDSVTVQAFTEILSQVSTRALKILSMHERVCLGFQTNAILLLVYPRN